MHDISSLIRAYNLAAQEAVEELRREYPAFTSALKLREAGIPSQGQLPSGRAFSFHGIGCEFKSTTTEVDVDFGPNGRCDGFDAWRLMLFAQFVGAAFSYDEIQSALDTLLNAAEIVKGPEDQLGNHLYYWHA